MGLIVNRQVGKNFVIDRKEEVINFRFRFFFVWYLLLGHIILTN